MYLPASLDNVYSGGVTVFRQVSVPENVRRGATVAWLRAEDPDSGPFGTAGVRYTDLSGDAAQL